jgi:DNA-binding transcriptional MerR regulator
MENIMIGAKMLAEHFRVSERTLRHWRSTGYGPPFVKLRKGVLYNQNDVDQWLESRREGGETIAINGPCRLHRGGTQ